MIRNAVPLTLGALALAGCAAEPTGPRAVEVPGYARTSGAGAALIVTRNARPFSYDEGAEARRVADAFCGAEGVASGLDDNFREDAWVFPGGCA